VSGLRRLVRPSRIEVAALAAIGIELGLSDPLNAGYVSLGVAVLLSALGLVVVSGWARQVNLAQYGFVGVGAYAASSAEGLPFAARLFVGVAAAALLAVPVGLAASRLAGLALGALTLVVGLTLWSLSRSPEVMARIGGDTFIGAAVSRPSMLTGERAYALFALAVGAIATLAVLAFRRTRTGIALASLAVGDKVMGSLGYESRRLVILGFVVSAGLAGLGGVVLAGGLGAVNANDILPFNSIVLYAFLFNAGADRPAAAVLTATLIPLTVALALPGYLLPLVGGVGLIVAGTFVPGGFLASIDGIGARRRAKRSAGVAPSHAPEPSAEFLDAGIPA
jgi:branched-chain amino acid transport system permease protein